MRRLMGARRIRSGRRFHEPVRHVPQSVVPAGSTDVSSVVSGMSAYTTPGIRCWSNGDHHDSLQLRDNIRNLIAQKEKVRIRTMLRTIGNHTGNHEVHAAEARGALREQLEEIVALSEQRMNQINKRTQDVEQRHLREQELAKTKQQFAQLTQRRHNLKLLERRTRSWRDWTPPSTRTGPTTEKADNALQQQKSLVTEREAEVRREKSRIAELEAYQGKVERLQKQTDDARFSKDA